MAGKEKEKLFLAAMKKKFKEAPTEVNTNYYTFGGWKPKSAASP
jgi:methyl-coenzyme M reductase alpha subunit